MASGKRSSTGGFQKISYNLYDFVHACSFPLIVKEYKESNSLSIEKAFYWSKVHPSAIWIFSQLTFLHKFHKGYTVNEKHICAHVSSEKI